MHTAATDMAVKCDCATCRRARAVTLAVTGGAGGSTPHDLALRQPWQVHPYTDAFFPTPFQRFVSSGALPTVEEVVCAGWDSGAAPESTTTPSAAAALVRAAVRSVLAGETPVPDDFAPVFVVGCGRSGTTLLSQLFGVHPRVVEVNEARVVWINTVPACDVWSAAAARRRGRLVLDAADAASDGEAVRRCRAALFAALVGSPKVTASATATQGAPPTVHAWVQTVARTFTLVEKSPENVFRASFLRAAFPGARFVVITRARAAVVSSIAKFSPPAWYGFNGYKWNQLVATAMARGWWTPAVPVDEAAPATAAVEASSAPQPCSTRVSPGAMDMRDCAGLEWDCSMAAGEEVMAGGVGAPPSLHLTFESLVTSPATTFTDTMAWLGLPTTVDAGLTTAEVAAMRDALATFLSGVKPDKAGATCAPATTTAGCGAGSGR